MERTSLDESKSVSNTNNEETKVCSVENQSCDEAVESFKSSFENLMPYYRGKKSNGKIIEWVKSILKPLIDSLSKS